MLNLDDFWGKTDGDKPGITPEIHSITVQAIGDFLYKSRFQNNRFKRSKKFQKKLKNIISFLCITHDVGKYYLGFQIACELWRVKYFPQCNKLLNERCLYLNGKPHFEIQYHGPVSGYSVYNYLLNNGYDERTAYNYAWSVASHHGYNSPEADGADFYVEEGNFSFESERQQYLERYVSDIKLPIVNDSFDLSETLKERFNIILPRIGDKYKLITHAVLKKEQKKKRELVMCLGMLIVSDWLGSDEKYHSVKKRPLNIEELQREVKDQLSVVGFDLPEIKKNLSFMEVFPSLKGKEIRDLQKKTAKAITSSGIYVIEAPMGEGKTEAALYAAYKLLEQGINTGIYFALPSQATSNSMYKRMEEFVHTICNGVNNTMLIHQMSWLDKELYALNINDSDNWFLSNRRALLAPFGVGTIDQALMSVIASKHYSVRRFGLAGKVIIIDEVHSYDTYTGTLIKRLCEECKELGCTIIILSATLRKKSRDEFVFLKKKHNPYPVITGITSHNKKIFLPADHQPSKKVHLLHSNIENAYKKAIECAKNGAVVVWICNTVDSAQDTYHKFTSLTDDVLLGQIHARFPYFIKKNQTDYWINKLGKDGDKREGCILISTQIIEQSVDIDADVMFSEVAPIDFIFQRMGRLWRHDFTNRPVERCEFILLENIPETPFTEMSSKEIARHFKPSSFFYDSYILMKTQIALSEIPEINLPNDIRKIIESVYDDSAEEFDGWEDLKKASREESRKLEAKAESIVNIFGTELIEEENCTTRANEVLYENLILIKSITSTSITFLDGNKVLIEDDFNFETKRAFAKNIVRIQSYYFAEKEKRIENSFIKRYTYGGIVGIVNSKGRVKANDIKSGYFLSYSEEYGIEINNNRGA